jgi:hypothetical protein
VQVPEQSISPDPHAATQPVAPHTGVAPEQTSPHIRQFVAEDRSASQPSAVMALQSSNVPVHAYPHVPELHVVEVFGRALQGVQLPHDVTEPRSASQPSDESVLQSS